MAVNYLIVIILDIIRRRAERQVRHGLRTEGGVQCVTSFEL